MRNHARRFLSLVAISLLPTLAAAQEVNNGNQTGFPVWGSFHGSSMDNVSLSNGNLHIEIPILSAKERGSRTLTYQFIYDTPTWVLIWFPPPDPTLQGYWMVEEAPSNYDEGWRLTDGESGWGLGNDDTTIQCSVNGTVQDVSVQRNFVLFGPDGTKHPTALTIQPNYCGGSQLTGPTLDGTGIFVDITSGTSIKLKDGRTSVSSGWRDSNGNIGPEMLGRSLLTVTSNSGYNIWTTHDSNGNPQTFRVDYIFVPVQTTLCQFKRVARETCYELSTSIYVPSKLTLPTGLAYQFQWDGNSGTADLIELDLPTGGATKYAYQSTGWKNPEEDRHQTVNARRSVVTRTVVANGQSNSWSYSGYQSLPTGTVTTVVVDPLNNREEHDFTVLGTTNIETQVRSYDSASHLLRTVSKDYASESHPYQPFAKINVRQIRETTTLDNGLVKKTETDYETFSANYPQNPYTATRLNPTEQREYDYAPNSPGPLVRKTDYSYLHNANSAYLSLNIVDRVLGTTVYSSSGAQVAQTTNEFDNYTEGLTASGAVQHDTNYGTSYTTRGNVTAVQQWRNTDGVLLTTRNQFDDAGNVRKTTDPLVHSTTFSYLDSWGNASCAPTGGNAAAYVTSVTNGLGYISRKTYNSCIGTIASATDANNLTTTFSYDLLNRLTRENLPDGGQTTNCYTDVGGPTCTQAPAPFKVVTTRKISSTLNGTTTAIVDGLGRLTQTQLNSDPQGTVYTDTTYDALGNVHSVSNPYRTGTDITTTTGTTTYAYDALRRKISETYPDNSVLTTAYCGSSTLVTDPTNRWRRSRVDALGRLIEVDEPNAVGAAVASTGCPGTGEPIWVTSYTNDALGNLTQVVQNGSHQRSFTYDSLSRLLTSSNPETGTITYKYDSDTNCLSPNAFNTLLVSKTDARGIRTCSQYDALNRETVRNYSNGDPSVTTTYDQANCLGLSSCANIGHRTTMTDAAGSESWSFDVVDRIHKDQRTTNSITKSATYNLDYAGNVTSAVYPTGRTVNYTYDAANRPVTAMDGSNGITYATGFQTSPGGTCLTNVTCYTPQGTFYALSIGQSVSFTGLNLTHSYNSRLQPLEFKASSSGGNAIDITYSFVDPSTSKNAGHVFSITNNLDSTRSQTFGFDQLNRITVAQTTSTYASSPGHCWGETYGVDSWGNLQSIVATTNSNYTGCSQESGFFKTADSNNHLSGFSYDVSGNTTNDGVNSYTWNAESQLTSGGGLNYLHDGDGRRVAKVGSKLYWYGSGGDILAETDASGNTTAEYIFFGGKRVALLSLASIDVRFTNDSCSGCGGTPVGGGDRNLFINSITIGSTTVLPNSPSVSYVTPPCNSYANGVGQLLCNGDLIASSLTGAPGQTITVNAYGSTDYNIYPHMQLFLNGALLGEWDVTGSAQNYSVTIPSTAVLYYVEDLLGTSRVLAQFNGVVCYDADFYPYGGERSYTNTCPQNYKFEGKERDTETGNDDFGARYYSNRFGRWLSADWSSVPVAVPYANLSNPQTLNLYAMVADDPESFADLDGHDGIWDVVVGVVKGVNNLVNHAYEGIVATAKDPFAPVTAAVSMADQGLKAYETSAGRQALAAQFNSLSTQDKAAVVTEALAVGGLASAANAPETDTSVTANRSSGLAFENKALASEGLTKNTTPMEAVDPKTGKTGTTIPDAQRANGQTVDAKNVKTLSDSPQLRRQSVISAKSGQKAQVLVNKNNIQKISPTVQNRMNVKKIDP